MKHEIETWNWNIKLKHDFETCVWNLKLKLEYWTSQLLQVCKYCSIWYGYRSLVLYVFWPFLSLSGWFLGLSSFQNMFPNLLIYTKNLCYGYITVSCFIETFLGWVVGKSDFNENPVVSVALDLDFGLRLRVCQFIFKQLFQTSTSNTSWNFYFQIQLQLLNSASNFKFKSVLRTSIFKLKFYSSTSHFNSTSALNFKFQPETSNSNFRLQMSNYNFNL